MKPEDPEIRAFVEKMESMYKELKDKTAHLIEKGGHSPLSVKRYLADPKNFSPKEWQLIQHEREAIERAIALPSDFKKAKKVKETKTLSKERRGKTLGTRKGWIDMH